MDKYKMDNYNVSQEPQEAQAETAKVVSLRVSAERRKADFYMDLEYRGFIFREIRGKRDRRGNYEFTPATTILHLLDDQVSFKSTLGFTSEAEHTKFQDAASDAFAAFMLEHKERMNASGVTK